MSSKTSNLLSPSVLSAAGNVPQEAKEAISRMCSGLVEGPAFGQSISRRMVVTEMNVAQKPEEPRKVESRIVMELDVEEDMINIHSSLHGGCGAYLVDFCSSVALQLHRGVRGNWNGLVSTTLNTVYHAPAPLGSRLKVVNTTIAVGARVMTARTEIYDITNQRLVLTGWHVKMEPTAAPKL